MPFRKKVVALLRIASAITIFMGLYATIAGLITAQTLHAFKVPVPAWLIGAAVAFVGVRYWLRFKDLEKKMKASGA